MTRRYIVPLILLLAINSGGCGKNVSIDNFTSEAWKNDRMGCNGDRMKMTNTLHDAQKQLTGLKKDNILALFGKPESIELYPKGQRLYRYHITPAKTCLNFQSEARIEILEIRINALGIVSEAKVNSSAIPDL